MTTSRGTDIEPETSRALSIGEYYGIARNGMCHDKNYFGQEEPVVSSNRAPIQFTLPDWSKVTELTATNITAVKSKSKRNHTMESSMKDQMEGTFHELKCNVKEVAGDLCDIPTLEAEGTGEKTAGKGQEKFGRFKKVLGK